VQTRPERRYYQAVTTSTAASPTSRRTRAFAPHLAAFIQDVVRKTPSSRSAHDGILRSSPPTPGNPELQYPIIAKLNEPRLIGRAAHLGDLQSFAASLAKSGVAAVGPAPGSSRRPDGRVLEWKALTLKENAAFLLPFFIQWCVDSIHPSADSPEVVLKRYRPKQSHFRGESLSSTSTCPSSKVTTRNSAQP
jgi:hypothetical protein